MTEAAAARPMASVSRAVQCIDLDQMRLVLAEAQQTSRDEGNTLDLSDKRIGDLPVEIMELIKDSVCRLALGHNLLTSLPTTFASFNRLRYLNIRSNFFREFPPVLCDIPTLEILDISRNKIRALPRSFGSLTNLKVLSMSKDRIEVLPHYIAQMAELRILKIDHNPIVFPPLEITANEAGEEGMDMWLMNLKDFLHDHAQKNLEGESSETLTTDDEGGDPEYNTISKTTSSDKTASSLTSTSTKSSSSNNLSSGKPSKKAPPPPIPIKNMHRSTPSQSSIQSVSNIRSFHLNPPKSADMERSRSNSESEDLRRPSRRPVAMSRSRNLATLQEDRARHSRGFSHDSHDYLQENASEAEGALPTSSEVQQNSRAYFRRLSSLPQAKRISLNSIKIVETARGLLFSCSQIHQAVRQYVGFCPDPELAATINRVLYNANAHVGALVDVLESHESRPDTAESTPVMEACRACVGAFRHVINIVHKRVRDLTSQADIRYTRTLLLLLFGASVELQNSWTCLRPSDAPVAPAPQRPSLPTTRLKSASNATQLPYLGMARTNGVSKHGGEYTVPSTPTMATSLEASASDTDDQLFEKISQATTVTLSLLSLIGDAVSKSALASAQGPGTPGAVSTSTNNKLRELAVNSMNAGEVSRRLKSKVVTIGTLSDILEKRKFWEDTNAFVKAVINVAALAKSVSSEYPFSKAILASLSTVTRSTKELTILLSVSSFSQTMRSAESFTTMPNAQVMVATTPLTASLGPAGSTVMTPMSLATPGSAMSTGTSTGVTNKFDEDFRGRPDVMRNNSTMKASHTPTISM